MALELTNEQRREYAAKAMEMRRRRAEVKNKIASGEMSLEELFNSEDECVARIRVVDVLQCFAGVGRITAENTMASMKISERRRVGGLTDNKKELLIEWASNHKPKRATE